MNLTLKLWDLRFTSKPHSYPNDIILDMHAGCGTLQGKQAAL